MPTDTQQQEQQAQEEQQRQQEWLQQQVRSQQQFDSAFGEQMFGDTATREVHQQYWQNAEDTLRQARRISEIYAMSLMQHSLVQKISAQVVPQITSQVTQQVIAQLQQNPQLLKQAVQQAQQR